MAANHVEEMSASELLRQTTGGEAPKESQPRGRRAAAPITKPALRGAIEFASMGLLLTGMQPLETQEITQLTDSWYEVIKLYPSVGKYLVMGNKLTVWGNALICTSMIVMRRLPSAPNNQTGPARTPMWHDWQRQNHSSEADIEQQAERHSS
jgi:hypothetical protein